MSESEDEKAPRPIPWLRIVFGTAVAYALFYAWALSRTHATLIAHYGALGDAFAPLAAFASTVGLIGALVSVNLQRRELALQRKDLELQRQEMADSRAELARTAKAQERLAESQERLAKAQQAAVGEATASRLATYGLTVSLLQVAKVSFALGAHDSKNVARFHAQPDLTALEARLEEQSRSYEQLRRILERGEG